MQELIPAFLQLAQDICKSYHWEVVSVENNRVEALVPFPDGETRRMWVECILQNDLVRIGCVFEEEHPQNDYIRARFEEALDHKAREADGKESLLATFLPSKDFWVTPVLLSANILIFVAMVVMGADVFNPRSEIMLAWGALFKPYVMEGSYWRLFTCMFLHFGLMHLAVNMYSLYSLGFFLEKLVGKGRFLLAYLAAGLLSSANSCFWGSIENASAGASGAIFGIFGMLMALVTSDIIAKHIRESIMKSLLPLVGINVAIAIFGGVDNAGHMGGLFAGAGIGFAYILAIKRPRYNLPIIGAIVVLYSLIGALLVFSEDTYIKNVGLFGKNERKSAEFYALPASSPPEVLLEKAIQGERLWQENIRLVKEILQTRLSTNARARMGLLLEYSQKRLQFFQISHSILNGTANDAQEKEALERCYKDAESILDKLEKLNK